MQTVKNITETLGRFFANHFGNWGRGGEFEFSVKKQGYVYAQFFALCWPPVGLAVLWNLCGSATAIVKQTELIAAVASYLEAVLTYYAVVLPLMLTGYVAGKWMDNKTDGPSRPKSKGVLKSDEKGKGKK